MSVLNEVKTFRDLTKEEMQDLNDKVIKEFEVTKDENLITKLLEIAKKDLSDIMEEAKKDYDKNINE